MKVKRRRDEGDFEGILSPQSFRKNFSMVPQAAPNLRLTEVSDSWDNPQKQLRVEIVERVGFEQNRLPPQSKSATFWQCEAER